MHDGVTLQTRSQRDTQVSLDSNTQFDFSVLGWWVGSLSLIYHIGVQNGLWQR